MQNSQPARKLPRIEPRQALQYRYLVIPQLLITDPAFAEIDCAAKLAYAMLLNRLTLSAENPAEYTDEEGQLFVIFTVEELQSTLHLSKPTAVKMLNQLVTAGLIEKKRQGQGKPTYIYVNNFTAAVEMADPSGEKGKTGEEQYISEPSDVPEKLNDLTSKSQKLKLPEVNKFNPSKNDLRNNDLRNILPSIPTGIMEGGKDGRNAEDFENPVPDYPVAVAEPLDVQSITEEVEEQISYEALRESHGEDVARAVVSLIVSVLARSGPVYLGKHQYPERLVKQRYQSLTYEDVVFALEKLYQTPGVRNQTAYLTTLLFNAPGGDTIEANSLFTQHESKYHSTENRNQFRFF